MVRVYNFLWGGHRHSVKFENRFIIIGIGVILCLIYATRVSLKSTLRITFATDLTFYYVKNPEWLPRYSDRYYGLPNNNFVKTMTRNAVSNEVTFAVCSEASLIASS